MPRRPRVEWARHPDDVSLYLFAIDEENETLIFHGN